MQHNFSVGRLLAGTAIAVATACAGAANADELTWSSAAARLAICQANICGTPGAMIVLGSQSVSGSNQDSYASLSGGDFVPYTHFNFRDAFGHAEAGDGDFALPVLHAAASGAVAQSPPGTPPYISVNLAIVQGVQGFTNTTDEAMLIPLSAFSGELEYNLSGPGLGIVSAGLAITTSAILQPDVANQWFANSMTPGYFGQFAATCGTTGALAIGAPASVSSGAGLAVSVASCSGSDTYVLNPGDSFYLWARLAVLRSGAGFTDAGNTFEINFDPLVAERDAEGFTDLIIEKKLIAADGGNFSVPDAAVPEPSAWALMLVGFGGLGAMIRRRRRLAALA